MSRKASNELMHKAKKAKSDEFYTQLLDIESELTHYTDHFKNKVVYCNCDDPEVSNFFKFFKTNFAKLGLKKVISSCYSGHKEGAQAYYVEYLEAADGHPSPLEKKPFFGDGDFRSDECIQLLRQADIVVTNPPFSLFREYVAQLVSYEKKFLIIGNVNAITYKEIFKLIQEDQAWLGINLGRGISGFIVPEHYELYGTEARIDNEGNRVVSPNNCLWLTNLETDHRRKDIPLTKEYNGNEEAFPKYDNFDGINVNKTKDIPRDYYGYIGVPITFLHKYNPDQFEIIKFRKGDDGRDLSIAGKCPYFRILIRRKAR